MKVRVSLVLFFSFVSALFSFGDGSSQVFHGQFGDARIRRSDGSSAQVFYDQFGNAKIRLSDGSSAQVVCDQFGNAKMRNSDGSSAQIVHDQFGNAGMRNSDGSSAQIVHDQFGNAQIVHDQFCIPERCNSGDASSPYGYRLGASSVQSLSSDRQSSMTYEPGDAYDTDQPSLIHSGAADQQLKREQNAMRMMVERMPIRSSTTPQIDGYRRIGADGQGGGCSFGDALGNIAVDVAVQELCKAFCDERNEGRTTQRSSVGGCSSDSDARFFVVFLIVVAVVIGIVVGILWLVVQLIRKLFSMFLNGILCFWRLEVSKVLLFMCIFLYMVNIYAWCVDFGNGWTIFTLLLGLTILFMLSGKVKEWGGKFLMVICVASFGAGVRYVFSGERESFGHILWAVSLMSIILLWAKKIKHDKMIAERKSRPKRWNHSN